MLFRTLAPVLIRGTRTVVLTMGNQAVSKGDEKIYKERPPPKVTFTEEDLRVRLSEEEYRITQERGTERAWTGENLTIKDDGVFNCTVCGTQLFKSDEKFESGTGWPSFTDMAKKGSVMFIEDESHGMVRTEAACGQCGAHLGHVFEDGPQETTGLRYCINSACLKFDPKKKTGAVTSSADAGGRDGSGDPEEGK